MSAWAWPSPYSLHYRADISSNYNSVLLMWTVNHATDCESVEAGQRAADDVYWQRRQEHPARYNAPCYVAGLASWQAEQV